jgi:hypothetical protein
MTMNRFKLEIMIHEGVKWYNVVDTHDELSYSGRSRKKAEHVLKHFRLEEFNQK